MTKIKAKIYGSVPRGYVDFVIATLNEFYDNIKENAPPAIMLMIFSKGNLAEGYYIREARKMGVITQPAGEGFYSTHDAWTGIPRIGIYFDRLKTLPNDLQMAILRHEAAHTVLHGSLECYTPPPDNLLESITTLGFSMSQCIEIVNILFLALKDYEVSSFLADVGFKESVKVYGFHVLKPDNENLREWEIVKGNLYMELIHLTSRLKDVFAVVPVLTNRESMKRFKDEISYLHDRGKEFINNFIKFISTLSGSTSEKYLALLKYFLEYSRKYLENIS